MKPNRNRARDLGFYVLLIVIMMAVIFTMTGEKDTNKIKNYSDLVDLFTEEKVQSFRTEGSTIIRTQPGGNIQGNFCRPMAVSHVNQSLIDALWCSP